MRKGVPFRQTHHVAGAAVQLAEQSARQLSDLTLAGEYAIMCGPTAWQIRLPAQSHGLRGELPLCADYLICSEVFDPPSELQQLHPLFESDVSAVWDFSASVEKRCSAGGTSRQAVLDQVAQLRATVRRHQ